MILFLMIIFNLLVINRYLLIIFIIIMLVLYYHFIIGHLYCIACFVYLRSRPVSLLCCQIQCMLLSAGTLVIFIILLIYFDLILIVIPIPEVVFPFIIFNLILIFIQIYTLFFLNFFILKLWYILVSRWWFSDYFIVILITSKCVSQVIAL
jgi:hypothetical protein